MVAENLLSSIGWLLSVAAATGNGFVVFLVAKNHRLHSSANWFVLSLAVADFWVGVAAFPSSYFCNYSTKLCILRVQKAFYWFFLHSSVTNLCVLTWDRYIAIVHPFKYNTSMTVRRPGMVIFVAWLVPFAISLSRLLVTFVTNSDTALTVLHLTGVSAFDIISCVLLFYAAVRILVIARAQSHQEVAMEMQVQPNHSSAEPATSRPRRQRNTALFIIALVLFFLGCYIVVTFLVLCITFSCKVSDEAGLIVTSLLVLNSAVNPLVYALLKRDIKLEIIKLICRAN